MCTKEQHTVFGLELNYLCSLELYLLIIITIYGVKTFMRV